MKSSNDSYINFNIYLDCFKNYDISKTKVSRTLILIRRQVNGNHQLFCDVNSTIKLPSFEKEHVILIKLFVRETIEHRYSIFNFVLLESK